MRLERFSDTELSGICVKQNQTIHTAMEIMTNAGLRFAPVVSEDDMTFYGLVTDGDLRRHLTRGGTLGDKVSAATNVNPYVLHEHHKTEDVLSLLKLKGIEYLPELSGDKLSAVYVLWATALKQDLKAVIMVGGLGSRLAPLTDNCPKPLLKLNGKPILSHILESLAEQGVRNFIFCVNHKAEMIRDYYDDGRDFGFDISYVHETKRLGTGGALSLIDPVVLSDPFLCLNGDILNDVDVDALRTTHANECYDATMVVRRHSYQIPYGVVKTDDAGQFTGSEEKPTMSYQINAGFYLLSKDVLPLIPEDQFFDLPTLFNTLTPSQKKGGTYLHQGRWIDIGNIDEFNRAKAIYEEDAQ